MRVVRVYHSGVVSAWRERDRTLRRSGVDVTLVSSLRWNEGGAVVELDETIDSFVVGARTFGTHPYLFVYDPRPIWRVLRRSRPDVFDCHEEPASLAALELLVLRWCTRRRPAVLFYGAQNIEKRFPIPFRWIERLALRTAAGVYCCNAAAGEIFRRKGFRGRAVVMGLGVDLDRFSPANPAPPTDSFRVGYVGRLEWRKGIHVVLHAFAQLPETMRFDVYGTGPDEARLRELAHTLGIADRVTFHGFQRHQDLPATYRSLDAIVVPSQTTGAWVEQFGRVVVEAMASGVPVVGSDSGSIPEVIGDAGLVVPESEPGEWAAALLRLHTDAGLCGQLRSAGLAHAERYSWAQIAADHLELYNRVTA